MSKQYPALQAVRPTKWDKAHESKLRDALRQHPIILDWLVDMQADDAEAQLTRQVDFAEPPEYTSRVDAYSKGRISALMELVGAAQILLEQPASGED